MIGFGADGRAKLVSFCLGVQVVFHFKPVRVLFEPRPSRPAADGETISRRAAEAWRLNCGLRRLASRLWSEVDLPGVIKVKRVVARTCRGWAVGAVKTASRAPRAMFTNFLSRSLPVQTGQATSPLVHHPMRHVAVTCNADL